MGGSPPGEFDLLATQLLDWLGDTSEPDPGMLALLYQELRQLAHTRLINERASHTWQTTDLAHELFLRVARSIGRFHLEDRRAFFRWAIVVMDRILAMHARARLADKRGGGQRPFTYTSLPGRKGLSYEEVLSLKECLTRFRASHGERTWTIVMLKYHLALEEGTDLYRGNTEIAELLNVDKKTVQRGWSTGKLFLRRCLEGDTV